MRVAGTWVTLGQVTSIRASVAYCQWQRQRHSRANNLFAHSSFWHILHAALPSVSVFSFLHPRYAFSRVFSVSFSSSAGRTVQFGIRHRPKCSPAVQRRGCTPGGTQNLNSHEVARNRARPQARSGFAESPGYSNRHAAAHGFHGPRSNRSFPVSQRALTKKSGEGGVGSDGKPDRKANVTHSGSTAPREARRAAPAVAY